MSNQHPVYLKLIKNNRVFGPRQQTSNHLLPILKIPDYGKNDCLWEMMPHILEGE